MECTLGTLSVSHGVWDSSRLQNNTFVQRAFGVVAQISADKTNSASLAVFFFSFPRERGVPAS